MTSRSAARKAPSADDAAARPARVVADVEELQRRIDELREELAESHRLATLGVVAGMIAHELNNVLTPVLSYAQMALARPEDRELSEKALRRAADGSQTASRIVSSVLALAGVVSVSDAASESPIADPAHVLTEALNCLVRDPARDGIELVRHVPDDLRVAIAPTALQQVLLNLLLNARRAMIPDGGRLTVRVTCHSEQGSGSTWNTPTPIEPGFIVIEVEDTGRGIEPALVERIFDPFVRESDSAPPGSTVGSTTGGEPGGSAGSTSGGAPGATPGRPPGSGLGLAVCQRLIEGAGGTIGVQSTLGEGTTFVIALPPAGDEQAGVLRRSA